MIIGQGVIQTELLRVVQSVCGILAERVITDQTALCRSGIVGGHPGLLVHLAVLPMYLPKSRMM